MLDYQDAVEAVWSFGDYFEKRSDHTYASAGVELGRVHRLLERLGSPQRHFRVITVAGTKGKGSTSAMVASILKTTGLVTGFYSQPHLHSYRERIQVNGCPLSVAHFVELARQVVEDARSVNAERPTENGLSAYEVGTAMALRHFADVGVDVAVLEVGLGGRLDAVNAVDTDLAVITPISHDHVNVLGSRLTQIAAEKAGVMRAGRPVVIAPQRESVRRQLARKVREVNALPTWIGARELPPAGSVELNLASSTQMFRLRTHGGDYGAATITLMGPHQRLNALVATVAAERFLGRIDREAILSGLAGAEWPGRLEIAGENPLIILDGAHNDHSASVLADSIRELVPEALPATFVLGLLRGKNIGAILREIEPVAHRYYITTSTHPRAFPVGELSKQVGIRSKKPITGTPTTAQALDWAKRQSGHTGLIVVTGSLSTVAEAREHLGLPMTVP